MTYYLSPCRVHSVNLLPCYKSNDLSGQSWLEAHISLPSLCGWSRYLLASYVGAKATAKPNPFPWGQLHSLRPAREAGSCSCFKNKGGNVLYTPLCILNLPVLPNHVLQSSSGGGAPLVCDCIGWLAQVFLRPLFPLWLLFGC